MIAALQKVEQDIAAEMGTFYLFGIFLRKGSTDRWDVAVGAPWFNNEKKFGAYRGAHLGFLSSRISESLAPDDLVRVSRVVPLSADDLFLVAVTDAVHVEHNLHKLPEGEYGGVALRRGYVITSQSPKSIRAR